MSLMIAPDFVKRGLSRDYTPHNLPVGAWNVLDNVRIASNAAHRFAGDAEMYSSIPIVPEFIKEWRTNLAVYMLVGDKTKLYRITSSAATDVTRTSGVYTGGTGSKWTGEIFGGVPILNLSGSSDPPQSWDGTANFQDLPNWPAGTYCKTFRTFKQFCLALNLTKSGTHYPTQVMWSDAADPGTVPTTWTPAADNLAGDYSFSATPGEVLDGLALGNSFFIYKDDSAYIMQVSSGTFVFNTTEAFRTLSLLTTGCVTEFEKKHFVVTKGDVVVHNGVEVNSIIDEVNREYLFSMIDPEYLDNVQVVANRENSEVWVGYPTVGSSGRLTEALVWNWRTGLWTQRELPQVTHMTEGRLVSGSGSPIVDSVADTINSATWAPDVGQQSTSNVKVLYGTTFGGNRIAASGQGWEMLGQAHLMRMERIGIPLFRQTPNGRFVVEPGLVKYISEAYPLVDAVAGTEITFRFGRQMRVNDPIDWGNTHTFVVGQDRKINLDMSFCYLSVRIECAEPTAVSVYGLEFDGIVVGRY